MSDSDPRRSSGKGEERPTHFNLARVRVMGLSLGLQGTGSVLAYLSQLVLAHALGAEGFGVVSGVVSLCAVLGLVLTVGGGGLALRTLPGWQVGGSDRRTASFVVYFYRVILLLSLVVTLICGLAVVPLTGVAPEIALGAAILSALTALWTFGGDVGRAVGRFATTYGASLVLRPLVTIICLLVVVEMGVNRDASTGIFALILAGVIAVAVQFVILWRTLELGPTVLRWHVGGSTQWLRDSPHYLLANGFVLLLLQADMLVCSLMLPATDLGHYAAAAKTVSVLSVVSSAVGTVVIPRLALQARDTRKLGIEARSATRWQLALVAIPAVALLVFAEQVLSLFGYGFTDAAWPLRILVLGQVVNMALGPGGTLLVYTGHPKSATLGYGVASVGSAIMCAIGTGLWGLAGAAAGSAAGVIFAGGVMWWLARRLTGVGGSVYSVIMARRQRGC